MPYRNNADKLAYMKRYRAEHLEQETERFRKWYSNNRESCIAQQSAYSKAHPEINKVATKKYRAKKRIDPVWRAKIAAKAVARRAADPEKARSKDRVYQKSRYETDVNYRIGCCLRARLTKKLRYTKAAKFDSTFALVGCGIEFLRGYLEGMFQPRMTWNNIHIDHIKPLASFDLTNENEQRKAFHYSNLQPLFAFDNMAKGAR